MAASTTWDYPEDKLFTFTLVRNVYAYFNKNVLKYNDTNSKLYSNFGHEVVMDFMTEDGQTFYNSLDKLGFLFEKTTMDSIAEYFYRETYLFTQTDRRFYVFCAKIAIVDLYIMSNKLEVSGSVLETIAKYVRVAADQQVLFDNYDRCRREARSLLNAVYKFMNVDFSIAVPAVDNTLGWDNLDLTQGCKVYLGNAGKQICQSFAKSEGGPNVTEAQFICFAVLLAEKCRESTEDILEELSLFCMNLPLLAIHCAKYSDFGKTDFTLDIMSKVFLGNQLKAIDILSNDLNRCMILPYL